MTRYLVAAAAVLVGGLLTAFGIRTGVGARRRRKTWLPIVGVVTGVVLAGSSGDLRALTVAFTSPDGRERRFVNRYSSNLTIARPGRAIDILVNPADFDDAVVAGRIHGGGCAALMFTVFGTIVLVGGCVGAYVLLR